MDFWRLGRQNSTPTLIPPATQSSQWTEYFCRKNWSFLNATAEICMWVFLHERGNNCDVFYNECELSSFPLKPFKCILSVERFLKPDCSIIALRRKSFWNTILKGGWNFRSRTAKKCTQFFYLYIYSIINPSESYHLFLSFFTFPESSWLQV